MAHASSDAPPPPFDALDASDAAGATREPGAPSAWAAARLLARGIGQTLGIVLGFLAFGLLLGGLGGLRNAPAPPYPPALMSPPSDSEAGSRPEARSSGGSAAAGAARRWLVDGFNVLHVGILHGRERGRWWEDDARERLLARLSGFDEPEAELEVVFDGPRPEGAGEQGRAAVVFAEDADAWLLREVGRAEEPARLTVVTADRSLADRARHRGAQVVSPRAFLARCG